MMKEKLAQRQQLLDTALGREHFLNLESFSVEKQGAISHSRPGEGLETEVPFRYLKEECRVLVAGAGGLGCEILVNLALSGFKSIDVVDMDHVVLSNLNRQFLFTEKDVGRPKAEVAAGVVNSRLSSRLGIAVEAHVARLEHLSPDFYKQFNLVLAGLDSVVARRFLNKTLHDLVEYDSKTGQPDPSSIIPLLDGGSEGLSGQCRTIIPSMTSCYECSLSSLPTQTSYPLCTIAETPRLPEHCVSFAISVLWPREHPGGFDTEPKADDLEAVKWLTAAAQKRAAIYGIQGVSSSLTREVLKHFVPAVASTNAIIASILVAEALKLSTYAAPILNNYLMYNGSSSIYTHTFEYERDPNCLVCGPIFAIKNRFH